MDVLLTLHDTLLTARGPFFLFLSFAFFVFAMVSNAVYTMCFFVQCTECQSGENFFHARVSGRSNQGSHQR